MRLALLASLLFLAIGLPTPGLQAETIKAVTEQGIYTYVQDGRVAGPASDAARAILERAGLDYSLNLYPWARAYDMARQEPNVLIYLIARTPERERQFQWVGEFSSTQPRLYRLRSRTDIEVASLDDARRYRVGVIRDDLRHEYLAAKGFDKLIIAASNTENFRRLLNGQTDLMPVPATSLGSLCEEAGIDPSAFEAVLTLDDLRTGVYFAYSLATPIGIVERSRVAFNALMKEGVIRPMP